MLRLRRQPVTRLEPAGRDLGGEPVGDQAVVRHACTPHCTESIVFIAPAMVAFLGCCRQPAQGEVMRVNDIDIHEVVCLPDLNDHLKSTSSKTQVQEEA